MMGDGLCSQHKFYIRCHNGFYILLFYVTLFIMTMYLEGRMTLEVTNGRNYSGPN